MLGEGFNNKARRWVREMDNAENRDSAFLISSKRIQPDPVFGRRNCDRGYGVPSPAKFQSIHLPSGLIAVPRAIPVGHSANGSGSDMDMSTDSDDEVNGMQSSLVSSSQDIKIPNGAGPGHTNFVLRKGKYFSDPADSEISSSRNRNEGDQGHGLEKLGSQGSVVPASQHFTDAELSDSVAGSEVSSVLFKNNNTNVASQGTSTSVDYYSGIGSQQNDSQGRTLQNREFFNDGVSSAASFAGSVQEIKLVAEQMPTFRTHGTTACDNTGIRDPLPRAAAGAVPSSPLPVHHPTFHASGLGPWYAVISYDACVRLCLSAWARGCLEAPIFLENECMLLRNAFGLKQVLLQPEEELLTKPSSELNSEGSALKPKKTFGKLKVQVRKVKMGPDLPTGCSISSLKPPMIKLERLQLHVSNLGSTLSSGCGALSKVRVAPHIPANSNFSRRCLGYVHAGTGYIKEVSGLLKASVTSLGYSSSSYEVVSETYSCLLRLKSLPEKEAVRMHPGSSETHVFLPDGFGDDLIIEVQDSKGKHCGRVVAQVAAVAEELGDKLRWWPICKEPEHELVGRIQLYINYSTSPDENNHLKCGTVAETVAYDFVLEVAMKIQHFKQRKLLLHGPWKWLVTEFASYYGVSDAYAKLRYLSYVMDVATPTADCLSLVHELLLPVVMEGKANGTLSRQENRIMGEVFDQVERILALVFENYKSLDESSQLGIIDAFSPATGLAAPALEPALKLYNLLHDILSSEAQLKLCRYFQTAAKKRSRRHLSETDEFISNNNGSTSMDSVALSTAYQKMKSLCLSIKNEIFTDMEIHNQHVLPSFIDLPNLSSSIYSVELCNRLHEFLVACPPNSPSPPVAELVIATADFQKDLAHWNIEPIKGGVDAKELFHSYIKTWIQDKRLALLDSCKLDKAGWSGVRAQHSATPFVDDMYDRLKETLKEYEVITCRWPEYTFVLENAIADVEKAIVEALHKQYADVLSPLKENITPIKVGLKYVQRITKGSICIYVVPEELAILLNSLKCMIDVLQPKIEAQVRSWGACMAESGNAVAGEYLSEVTVMMRSKFRNYMQAMVEKLAENTRMQGETKLKNIIQDSKETVVESDIRSRMQPLQELLMKTIDHLHTIFETQLFIIICRGLWDRMGQDVLRFLENRKENRSWYKSSRVAVSILDDTFASQMQQLLGNAHHEKDLEPPRSMMAVRSMLCKDAMNCNDDNYYY
ncbi:uncharacterized protein LOC127804619 isoform X2 [Diospyros lotus]|uniref:uncharacterized protein LOC127804619 isoform X2 n=1 Tax=Diospyros lotus TaxID=55363 RepID=UPI0022563147|nr:uncharacterized protein LOC127804619 isoform X2 [Diospyros lotus]